MAPLACVSVPHLPLQLLLRRRPEWRAHPVAVVPDEKVQSRILSVNALAHERGVRPGMRYGAGLSLAGGLRASPVPPAEVAAGVKALAARLRRFSPHVEPSREEPGVFWLDGSGLGRLYPSPRAWVEGMQGELQRAGFVGAVVAGCTRFGSYALARAGAAGGINDAAVFADAERERRAAAAVPLHLLGLAPELGQALHQLGVATLRELLALPATGLLARFGPQAWRLHRLASGALAEPFQPSAEPHPVREEILLEYPEADASRLLFLIKAPFHALLQALAARRQSLGALHLRFLLEGEGPLDITVRPAAPTRQTLLLLDLVRLRLERLALAAGVTGIELLAEGMASEVEQLSLFAAHAGRDLAAGERALARLRAEFGEQAVVWARLREGHLPEARFSWELLERLRPPAPPSASQPVAARQLVRRFFQRPLPLPPQTPPSQIPPPQTPPPGAGALRNLQGPYAVSGGWWAREQHRDYYFAESVRGELLWVYHDRRRGRWYQQGRVE